MIGIDEMIDRVLEAKVGDRIAQRLEALIERQLAKLLEEAVTLEDAVPVKRSRPGQGPGAAIVKALEAGPLTPDEFANLLAAIDGTNEAKRQALSRLQKAGTVQRDPGGSYRLGARPT